MEALSPSITLSFEFGGPPKEETISQFPMELGRGSAHTEPPSLSLARLRDPSISRQHAILSFDHDRFWIQDQSQWGTWVNGRKLPSKGRCPLFEKDRIGLGRTTATVVSLHPAPPRRYDVFLSYSSPDREAVRSLGTQLAAGGISFFYDEWDIKPGDIWQNQLSDAMNQVAAVVFCLGAGEIGRWAWVEAVTAFQEMVERNRYKIIPVLLPTYPAGQDRPLKLPKFFQILHWVDLRQEPTADQLRLLQETIHRHLTA